MGGGTRKYTAIWEQIKIKGSCLCKCPSTEDIIGTINGVKKEKVRDKNKPRAKLLDISYPEEGQVLFRLITDTSINNL